MIQNVTDRQTHWRTTSDSCTCSTVEQKGRPRYFCADFFVGALWIRAWHSFCGYPRNVAIVTGNQLIFWVVPSPALYGALHKSLQRWLTSSDYMTSRLKWAMSAETNIDKGICVGIMWPLKQTCSSIFRILWRGRGERQAPKVRGSRRRRCRGVSH